MNKLLYAFITCIILASCGGETYTCSCTSNDKEVGSYKIEASKKSSAAFECRQKQLQYSSDPELKHTQCALQ